MKKHLFSVAIAVMTCACGFAQNPVVCNPDNKAYFGIRVGGDITCPGKITSENVGLEVFKSGGGIEFGGVYNVPVVANFYIEPGLKLYYDTYSYKKDFAEALQVNSISMKKFGMRIPVMAGYHFDFTDAFKLMVFTGPELEIGFSAKETAKGGGLTASESVYGEDGGLKRVNVLWGIGAGFAYQHFYFGVNGGIGMLNMMTESDVKFHENRVTLSVGYNF